jgi:hypothetical protein
MAINPSTSGILPSCRQVFEGEATRPCLLKPARVSPLFLIKHKAIRLRTRVKLESSFLKGTPKCLARPLFAGTCDRSWRGNRPSFDRHRKEICIAIFASGLQISTDRVLGRRVSYEVAKLWFGPRRRAGQSKPLCRRGLGNYPLRVQHPRSANCSRPRSSLRFGMKNMQIYSRKISVFT